MNPKPLSRRRFFGQAGCAALSSLPILNTLLNLSLMGGIAKASAPATGEYRALVCLFLSGGNDSFNMLVPREASAYAAYQASRTGLALPPGYLHDISPVGLPNFGVHGAMPEIADLFQSGKAAFVANVGTLVEPVQNRTQVALASRLLPQGLYSHSDQTEQWQTAIATSRSGAGWSGRMADLLKDLNSNQFVPMQISLDGANNFQTGHSVSEYAITPDGAIGLSGYNTAWSQYQDLQNSMSAAVDSQLAQKHVNLLAQTFNKSKRQALDAFNLFTQATSGALPGEAAFPDTPLGNRLKMVAKAIKGRNTLGHQRQTFFVKRDGWDHHDEVLTNQEVMLGEVSAAIAAFHNSLTLMGLQDQVCLFTASDFGRTLTSNGRGSDHAWGGNQLVVGGGVQGKRIFGTYPNLAVNPNSGPEVNPLDTGRGRFIPTTSCDVFFAELALWLGVSKTNLPLVLPNIGAFYNTAGSAAPLGMLV